jgi:hypothetical protein
LKQDKTVEAENDSVFVNATTVALVVAVREGLGRSSMT